MTEDVYMVSYLKSGRCWWVLRCYTDESFDLWFTNEQPKLDDGIPRTRYDINDLDKVIQMGELRDWIAGIYGRQ